MFTNGYYGISAVSIWLSIISFFKNWGSPSFFVKQICLNVKLLPGGNLKRHCYHGNFWQTFLLDYLFFIPNMFYIVLVFWLNILCFNLLLFQFALHTFHNTLGSHLKYVGVRLFTNLPLVKPNLAPCRNSAEGVKGTLSPEYE